MITQKTKLKLDWATFESTKYACQEYHYSKTVPAGKLAKIGVWEDDQFIGVVVFGHGANNNACKSFQLEQTEVCELVRVALKAHKSSVSKILSIALTILRKKFTGIKLVFSYADKTNQNHFGTIYQASNFIYLGERKTSDKGAYYMINGKKVHGRSARAKYGSEIHFPAGWTHCPSETKHLYIYIIDKNYVTKFASKPYPKRATSVEACTSDYQSEGGGSIPTVALQCS